MGRDGGLQGKTRRWPPDRSVQSDPVQPALGDALLALQDAEQHHTSLDARTRQVVTLTVGAIWVCDYGRYDHAAAAGKTGLSATTIGELSRGDVPVNLTCRRTFRSA